MEKVINASEIAKVPQPLGPRLRVARENAHLTEVELAQRAGVMVQSIVAWESDKTVPRANRLQMLAGILGVSLSWFLEGREDAFMETQGTASINAMQKELERLHATLDEAKAIAKKSLNRLTEISNHPDWGNNEGH